MAAVWYKHTWYTRRWKKKMQTAQGTGDDAVPASILNMYKYNRMPNFLFTNILFFPSFSTVYWMAPSMWDVNATEEVISKSSRKVHVLWYRTMQNNIRLFTADNWKECFRRSHVCMLWTLQISSRLYQFLFLLGSDCGTLAWTNFRNYFTLGPMMFSWAFSGLQKFHFWSVYLRNQNWATHKIFKFCFWIAIKDTKN